MDVKRKSCPRMHRACPEFSLKIIISMLREYSVDAPKFTSPPTYVTKARYFGSFKTIKTIYSMFLIIKLNYSW